MSSAAWLDTVADARAELDKLREEIERLVNPLTEEGSSLARESLSKASAFLDARTHVTSITSGLEQALCLHTENTALALEIKALELIIGDEAARDLSDAGIFFSAITLSDGGVPDHEPSTAGWRNEEDGGDAVSPDASPSRQPRQWHHQPPPYQGIVTLSSTHVKAMLFTMAEVENQLQRDRAFVNRKSQTDDDALLDLRQYSKLAFDADVDITPEIRSSIAISSASSRLVRESFSMAQNFDQEVLQALRSSLSRATLPATLNSSVDAADEPRGIVEAIERFALGIEPDSLGGFARSVTAARVLRRVVSEIPEKSLFACDILGPRSSRDAATLCWARLELSTHYLYITANSTQPSQQPVFKIPIEEVAYCAPLIPQWRDVVATGSSPERQLREEFGLRVAKQKRRGSSTEVPALIEIEAEALFLGYGADAFEICVSDPRQDSVEMYRRIRFIAGSPHDANTLRLLFLGRMSSRMLDVVFPSLTVPSCWRRMSLSARNRAVMPTPFGTPLSTEVKLDPAPASPNTSELCTLTAREREICAKYAIGANTFIAIREVLLKDPLRQWFSPFEIACRLPRPFDGLDWALAIRVALHFVRTGEARGVQFVEILPEENQSS